MYQVVEADRNVKDVLLLSQGVTRKNPSLREESNLSPFNSTSQQRLFHSTAKNSIEGEAIK